MEILKLGERHAQGFPMMLELFGAFSPRTGTSSFFTSALLCFKRIRNWCRRQRTLFFGLLAKEQSPKMIIFKKSNSSTMVKIVWDNENQLRRLKSRHLLG